MVKIKITELKEFLRRSRAIKPNPLIPEVFGRLLLQYGEATTLSKTNLHAHCRHEIEAEHTESGSILIDEKIMSALIQNTTEEYITISTTKDHVVLSAGDSKVKHSREDPAMFSAFPKVETVAEPVEFPAEVLYSIRAATSIIDTTVETQFSYCYLVATKSKTDIFSTRSAHIFYRKQFDIAFPSMPLSPEIAAVITMYENVKCSTGGSYVFFDCGKTQYCFVLSVYKAPPYQKILSQCTNKEYFEINRTELIRLCDLILSSSPAQVPETLITDGGTSVVKFSHFDPSYNVAVNREFRVDKNFEVDEFMFNAKLLLPLLKTIESETIRFSPARNEFQKNQLTYSIWSAEDPGIQTVLSGLVNQ